MLPRRERETDIGWKYGEMINGDRHKVRCKFCGKILAGGGITRFKQHLASVAGETKGCTQVPIEIKAQIRATLLGKKNVNEKKKIISERIENMERYSNSDVEAEMQQRESVLVGDEYDGDDEVRELQRGMRKSLRTYTKDGGRSEIVEAVTHNTFQKICSALEPFIHKVVKVEVKLATKHLACKKRHCGKQIYPSTSRSLQLQFKKRKIKKRSLQLQFTNKLSLPIFTGTKIEGKDCSVLNIVLVDAVTGLVVTSGPESSMKVEIVVLEGDFEDDEDENWTFEEFQDNVVREREGKRPLLRGVAFLNLNEGTGAVEEIVFTYNSSWTRSRMFRLGARVADGYFGETRVREAKTEAFMVNDHHEELYKKQYPPSLTDEVRHSDTVAGSSSHAPAISSPLATRLTAENPCNNFSSFQKSGGYNFIQPSVSSPDNIVSFLSIEGLWSFDDFALQGINNIEFRNESESCSFPSHGIYKDSKGLYKIVEEEESISQTFCIEDHLGYFNTDTSQPQNRILESQADSGSSFLATPAQPEFPIDKAQTTWMMLVAILQWRYSMKRIVARKKKGDMVSCRKLS